MATWSCIRHKLEKEYLAESLRGHIQYFATTYRRSHDQEGRASIRLDGKEILNGSYFNYHITTDGKCIGVWKYPKAKADELALKHGLFDQISFYRAFEEFDNQSIEKSLESENLLVKIFALLDKRVGKRRLKEMNSTMQSEPDVIQMFYNIRLNAEGIKLTT